MITTNQNNNANSNDKRKSKGEKMLTILIEKIVGTTKPMIVPVIETFGILLSTSVTYGDKILQWFSNVLSLQYSVSQEVFHDAPRPKEIAKIQFI